MKKGRKKTYKIISSAAVIDNSNKVCKMWVM